MIHILQQNGVLDKRAVNIAWLPLHTTQCYHSNISYSIVFTSRRLSEIMQSQKFASIIEHLGSAWERKLAHTLGPVECVRDGYELPVEDSR